MAGLGEHFFVWFDKLEVKVFGPTTELAGISGKVCASSLKTGVHFAYKSCVADVVLTEVKEKMKESLKSMRPSKWVDAIRSTTKCESRIYETSSRLLSKETAYSKRIQSEAALSYVLGEPIMEMMCDSGELKVQLEESVRSSNELPRDLPSTLDTLPAAKKSKQSASHQEITATTPSPPRTKQNIFPSTPSTAVAEATSPGSRADYTCYTIRGAAGVLAVVIETKMEQSSQDALAQVMGYVAAFRKDDMRPPVAVVVTEKAVDVLLFPFIKDSQRLLTAAHLSFQLWETPMLAERNCLRLLSCLFYAELMDYQIQYHAAESHEEMRKIVEVLTVTNIHLQKIAKLEGLIEYLERQLAEGRSRIDGG
jgi:hypothetical protein